MSDAPAPGSLDSALTSIARAIGESLDLQEVWGRVADACRAVVPFDGMGISLFGAPGTVRMHAARRRRHSSVTLPPAAVIFSLADAENA